MGSFVNLLEIDSPNRINDSINISNEPDNDFMTFSLFSKTPFRKFPNPKNAVFGNNLHFPKVDRAFGSSQQLQFGHIRMSELQESQQTIIKKSEGLC